jgi:LPXTG-motif cell wall-anchored protein
MWGGQTSPLKFSGVGAPPNNLWRFDADGEGGGSWTGIPVPDSLVRPADAFFASANGVGYILGGYVSAYSVPARANDYNLEAIPGLTSYDMSSNVWANESTSLVSPNGLATAGQLIYVSTFGKLGVLVSLGGSSFPEPGSDDGSGNLPFSEIAIYDIESGDWFQQVTSGQVPPLRLNFCAAGVEGNNGTYEIFIHGGDVPGGSGAASNIAALDQIYVLSLPSFQWFEADYTPTMARFGHSCHVVGYGQRQLLIVGGAPSIGSWIDTNDNVHDQWSWGLGVWDMTEMRWSDRYDAQAEPYVTSDVVMQGIQQNGQYPSSWTQPGVQQLFQKQEPARTPTSRPTGSSHLSTGAIAGIAVAAAAIIILLALFYLRRRRRNRRREVSEQLPQAQHQYHAYGGNEDVQEMATIDNDQLGLRRKPVNEVEGDAYHGRPYSTRDDLRELMGSHQRLPPTEMPS